MGLDACLSVSLNFYAYPFFDKAVMRFTFFDDSDIDCHYYQSLHVDRVDISVVYPPFLISQHYTICLSAGFFFLSHVSVGVP